MTNKDIRHPDILVKIGKMISSGMSYPSICNSIKDEWGINTTANYVKKVYETYSARRTEILQGDLELKSEIKQEILDWKDQIGRLNRMTWSLLDEAKGDLKLKAMREVRGQLELQNKILGRLEDSMTGKVINRIQITQDVIRTLEQLEKDGMITILRRPGEIIDVPLEKKEEYVPELGVPGLEEEEKDE